MRIAMIKKTQILFLMLLIGFALCLTDGFVFDGEVNAADDELDPPDEQANMPPDFGKQTIANIVATAGVAIPRVFLPEATDSDGDTLTYSISPALPVGLVFNRTARAITGTPRAAMAQTAYAYIASDGRGGSNTLPFFITVNAAPNRAPVYPATPVAITGTVGVAITPVVVAATDPDGDVLTYSWDVDETALGLMLNPWTGIITGTPNKVHTGTHPVTATDPDGLSAMRGVNVTIRAAPVVNVAPVVTITTQAPTAAQMNMFEIAYTATDANRDALTETVTYTVAPATATGYTVTHNDATNMVTIMQAPGSPIAVIEVTITATDAAGLSGSDSISVAFAARGTPPFWIYYHTFGPNMIIRILKDGTNKQNLLSVPTWGANIALDVTGGKMYLGVALGSYGGDPGEIRRANLDGSNVEVLINSGRPEAIALDVAGGKMYYAVSAIGIQRANLDGSNVEVLINSGYTRGIALDVAGGKMYYTVATREIRRANLDGSNVEVLVDTDIAPVKIALDVAGGKMYWTEPHSSEISRIRRANLDGSNVEVLITVPSRPPVAGIAGIALDVSGGKMYWTNYEEHRIRRANLDGSNVEDIITNVGFPYSIALGISQPSGPSPPTAPISFNPGAVADQTFTVGTSVSLTLPEATGGTPPYAYSISPPLPPGLHFDPLDRWIGGIPTVVMQQTRFTYTAADATGATASLAFNIAVTGAGPDPLDVNGDGNVDVLDLVQVALFYGKRGDNLPEDVNANGVIDVTDLVAVANGIDAADDLSLVVEQGLLLALAEAAALQAIPEAPIVDGRHQRALSLRMTSDNVAIALADVRVLAGSDVRLKKGITVLEELLQLLAEMGATPKATALLPNYPNPFNPETWIPYQLSKPADVSISIYAADGRLVRTLALGYQPVGIYESRSRAAYWDGKNALGESVASSVYFYTLTAGDFTATRKMSITK